MRFQTFFLAVAAFLLVPTFAVPARHTFTPAKTTNAPAPRSVLKQHVERRAILDVCAYIDTSALLGINIPGLGLPIEALGHIEICLCLSALPVSINLNAELQALALIHGKDTVSAALAALINGCPNSQHCQAPAHGHLQCTKDDPCGVVCDAPYIKHGNQCVCAPPLMECNGKCGYFPHGCGSAVPGPWRRTLTSKVDSLAHVDAALL
ncbi:hypothetical protein K474DRAFT_587616 [Panus rudis PR-1116 ss-1]|nr:hypothetical protein K474DRAFT_587616 [Panus rudis PR-1116 ss-1]